MAAVGVEHRGGDDDQIHARAIGLAVNARLDESQQHGGRADEGQEELWGAHDSSGTTGQRMTGGAAAQGPSAHNRSGESAFGHRREVYRQVRDRDPDARSRRGAVREAIAGQRCGSSQRSGQTYRVEGDDHDEPDLHPRPTPAASG